MGKWKPNKRAGCWVARKDHNELIGWVLLTDCDKDTATRYALALNIVDAGVDIQNMIPKPKLEVRCLSGDDVDSGFEHEEQSDWMLYVNGKPLSSDDVWTCGEAVSRGQDLLVALGIDQSGGITVIADAVEGDTTKEDI